MKRRDPINRYLHAARREAAARTARAAEEARRFARTGEVQRVDRLLDVRNDERTTTLRLASYQGWLARARAEGRYAGGTRLKRVLADGSTEPWRVPWPPASVAPNPLPHGPQPSGDTPPHTPAASPRSPTPPPSPSPRPRPWNPRAAAARLLPWLIAPPTPHNPP